MSKSNKEKQSASLLIKKMIPTKEELQYRMDEFKDCNLVNKYSKYLKCTKCHCDFKSILNDTNQVKEHPLLGVLICKNCSDYYGDGNFSLDSDGEDKYCRWCGEGGTILTCSKCICGFCDQCIKYHFGNDELKKVQKDDDWVCYFCNSRPLWSLRSICSYLIQGNKKLPSKRKANSDLEDNKNLKENTGSEIIENQGELSSEDLLETSNTARKAMYNHGSKRKKFTKPKAKQILISSSSNESESDNEMGEKIKTGTWTDMKGKRRSSNSEELDDSETSSFKKHRKYSVEPKSKSNTSFKNRKQEIIEKLEGVLKLTKYHMGFGFNWSTKKLLKLNKLGQVTTEDKLKKECQKIKWFISVLSSYLVGFCNSVESIERSLNGEDESVKMEVSAPDLMTYTSITQFLGFVTNQVRAFSEKGISFQDLLESEIYDDAQVLGIKKKNKTTSLFSPSAYSGISKTYETKMTLKNDDEINNAYEENRTTQDNSVINDVKENECYYRIEKKEIESLKLIAKKISKPENQTERGMEPKDKAENNENIEIAQKNKKINNSYLKNKKEDQLSALTEKFSRSEVEMEDENLSGGSKKPARSSPRFTKKLTSSVSKAAVVDEELMQIVSILESG